MTSFYEAQFIGFNRPHMVGKELWYIAQAHHGAHLASGGPFTLRCQTWLEETTGCHRALLTHSCTAALEMAALLADIGPGDEVIMPSYTFVSTANAFVLRGGVPVFVDIRADTLNLDESLVEAAITERTRAIVPVHYAGVACEMDGLSEIARRHDLLVIEDAAQGLMASYRERPLGSLGTLAAVSFHETKNVIAGEGGALLINDQRFIERAEILLEKGTDRSRFFRGEVDKYTWVDLGSSYAPSELVAAFLYAQMEEARAITDRRLALWNRYHQAFAEVEAKGLIRRPVIPPRCRHNAHMYYLLLPDQNRRDAFIAALAERGIQSVFHYVPLHSAPAGRRFGRTHGDLPVTEAQAARVARLPLWLGLEPHQQRVIDAVLETLETLE